MPGQRSPSQKLLTFPADKEFIALLDRAVRAAGYPDRSKFIREALAEKLASCGVKVPASMITSPARIGKGGRPTHKRKSEKTPPGGKFTDRLRAKLESLEISPIHDKDFVLPDDIDFRLAMGVGKALSVEAQKNSIAPVSSAHVLNEAEIDPAVAKAAVEGLKVAVNYVARPRKRRPKP